MLSSSGCGGSAHPGGPPQANVFTVLTGFSTTTPIQPDQINDIGLPPLHNTTGDPVRLVSVSFPGAGPYVHIVNVLAYNYRQTKQLVIGLEGALYAECPKYFLPRPITSFITPAHAATDWFVVIAYAISRPGTYHLFRVKLTYRTSGHGGWQYQNINDTIVVSGKPDPGLRPLPASAVCP